MDLKTDARALFNAIDEFLYNYRDDFNGDVSHRLKKSMDTLEMLME